MEGFLFKKPLKYSELLILGSASGVPTKNRFCTSIGLGNWNPKTRERDLYLFDCGAPCTTLLYRMGYDSIKLKTLFISHFHPDHVTHLPLLVQTLQLKCRQIGRVPLKIFGPKETRKKIMKLLEFCYLTPDNLPFKIIVEDMSDGKIYDSGSLRVDFFETSHIRSGESIGFIIRTNNKKVIYTGDVGRLDIQPYLTKCDILIHEFGHHTPKHIGTIAEEHNVSRLVITHINPRWDKKNIEIKERIRKHFSGEIIVANDKTRIIIPH